MRCSPLSLAAWFWVLFVLGCAPSGPPIAECSVGRYHADCGGSGPPTAACDASTGECRWFLGGLVADGYVASDCPADDLCCVELAGGWTWPFASWAPSGDVLWQVQDDLAILDGGPITASSPTGIGVTLDYVPPAVPVLDLVCPPDEIGGGFCDFGERLDRRTVGQSLVLEFHSGSLHGSVVVEVWEPEPGSLRARMFTSGREYFYTTPAVHCGGEVGGASLSMMGTLRLSGRGLVDAESVHGELDVVIGAEFGGGRRLLARF